jgi:hypothetical protein
MSATLNNVTLADLQTSRGNGGRAVRHQRVRGEGSSRCLDGTVDGIEDSSSMHSQKVGDTNREK